MAQATNIVVSNITASSATLSWTRGNGSGVSVFVGFDYGVELTYPLYDPYQGEPPVADAQAGSGSSASDNGNPGPEVWFCVYRGTGTTVNVTGLGEGMNHRVHVAEYDGDDLIDTTSAANNPKSFVAEAQADEAVEQRRRMNS